MRACASVNGRMEVIVYAGITCHHTTAYHLCSTRRCQPAFFTPSVTLTPTPPHFPDDRDGGINVLKRCASTRRGVDI